MCNTIIYNTTMKKNYIAPNTICVKLAMRDGVMDILSSVAIDRSGTTSEQLVKDNQVSSSSSYNVWDDDWSD